jgi:ferrochelatase
LKIETLVNLVGGELLNSPFISEVTSFTKNASEVKRGSCFFAFDSKDIKKAVENGAYAVISPLYEDIIDKEIAWIKVDNLINAIFDVFKYDNIKNSVYYTDQITSMILKKMQNSKNLFVLESIDDLLEAMNYKKKYLVTSKSEFKDLFLNVKEIENSDIELSMLTLFKSKFKNHTLNLPYVYKKSFAKAYNFLVTNEIEFILEFEIERFKPVYVDRNMCKVEYGESERVVIEGLKNDEIFFDELNYIIANTKHAKTVFINDQNKNLLNEFYNFIVLVDTEIEYKEKEEGSLFD